MTPPNPILQRYSEHNPASDLEEEQEKLRDAREELLGSRFHLQKQRGDLRRRHRKTGEDEGVIISLLRNVFLDAKVPFPEEITTAFSELEILRDELGTLENDYEEAEEKYNQQEWKYTQKESAFVERFATHGVLDDNFQFNENIAATADLTRYAHGSEEPSEFSYVEIHERIVDSGLLRDDMGHFGKLEDFSGTERFAEQNSGHPNTGSLTERNVTSMIQTSSLPGMDEAVTPPPRAYSESALSQARAAWSDTRRRIDQWILETVSCSRLQKARLKRLLAQDNLDDESWWSLVLHYWSLDSLDVPPLRLGIAQSLTTWETASDQCRSNQASTTHKVESEKTPDLKLVTPALLLPDDTVLGLPDPLRIPETLDPNDLLNPRATSDHARGDHERSDTPIACSSRRTSTFSRPHGVGSCQTDMTRQSSPTGWTKPLADAHLSFQQDRITGLKNLSLQALDHDGHSSRQASTDGPLEENSRALEPSIRDGVPDNPIEHSSQEHSIDWEERPRYLSNTHSPYTRYSNETLIDHHSSKDGSLFNSGDGSVCFIFSFSLCSN